MLAPKKSKFTSVVRLHLNVISIFSVVIGIGLQNGCIESVASEAQNVSLEYIEKTCIEKCADQSHNTSNSVDCMDQCAQNQDILNEQQEILNENLQSSTDYTIGIRMGSEASIAPAAVINMTTAERPEVRYEDTLDSRLFITHIHNPDQNSPNIEAIFRWNSPKAMIGSLIGYKISCWYEKDNSHYDLFSDYHLQPEINEKYMENIPKNATLYCRVKAETIAGEESHSSFVSMSTHIERPLPRLFATSNAGIYIVDFDFKRHKLIVNAGSRVDQLCFIALSKQLFWTNEYNELMSYSREGEKKLFSSNSPVLSITVDWIEHILYWSQLEKKGSSINAFNLNTQNWNFVLQSSSFMINLNVAPLNRELFWIESELPISTRGTLVSYHYGSDHSTVFRDAKNATLLVTQKTLFLDTFTEGHEQILWLNEYNQLMSTDIRSRVSTLSNFSYQSNMMNVIRDSGRMYWTQSDTVFAENPSEQEPYQHKLFYPMKILPIFRQNYPPIHCLLPRKHFDRKDHLSVYDSSDRSLWLHLPVPKRSKNCSFELISLKYTIMYTELLFENVLCSAKTCKIIETYDKIIEITNLRPYTRYQFQMSISNYYTDNMNIKMKFTRPAIFETNTGAPSQPRNVSATILSPTEINLNWLPPEDINGPSINYVALYRTEKEINGFKNQLQLLIKDEKTSINITTLQPNTTYEMWIRAYTSETLYNQSVLIKITTVPDLIIRDPDNAYILIAVAVLSFAAVLILAFGCLILVFLAYRRRSTDDDLNQSNEYEEIDANAEYEYIEYTTTL